MRLRVRLTPRAGRAGLAGVVVLPDGRQAAQIRVAAAPVDGAANDALIACLADALHVPRSRLRLASGQTSRLKAVEIEGDPESLTVRLIAWLDAPSR